MQKYRSREEYQQEAIETIGRAEVTPAIVWLPTSAGKTHVFCQLIKKKAKSRFLIIVNTVTLVNQTALRVKEIAGIEPSIYCGSLSTKNDSGRIVVGTIQSLRKNFDVNQFDYVIHDECHNITQTLVKLEKGYAGKWVGFTATPFKGSYLNYGEKKFYKDVLFKIKLEELIRMGFICPYIMATPKESYDLRDVSLQNGDYNKKELGLVVNDPDKLVIQIQDIIQKTGGRKKIAIACVNIEHAEMVSKLINKIEPCVVIHSNMSKGQRAKNLAVFEGEHRVRFMCSVDVVREGYDYPAIDCVIFLRPTRSITVMIQMAGRGLRLYPGKSNCLLLDYGEVFSNCGSLDNPIVKDPITKKKISGDTQSLLTPCPKCTALNHPTVKKCFACGSEMRDGRLDLSKQTLEAGIKLDEEENYFICRPKCFEINEATTRNGARYTKIWIHTKSNKRIPVNIFRPSDIDFIDRNLFRSFKFGAHFDLAEKVEIRRVKDGKWTNFYIKRLHIKDGFSNRPERMEGSWH